MEHKKKLAVINSDSMYCTYGGVAPFMRNMDPFFKEVYEVSYYHLPDGNNLSKIPGRIRVMFMLLHNRKELKKADFILSHVPEGSFVVSYFGVPYAHIYHGNSNPMVQPRFRFGKLFFFVFELFFKRIQKTASIEYTVGNVIGNRKKLFNPVVVPDNIERPAERCGFLFAGRLEKLKNIDRLIEIYSKLPDDVRSSNPFYIAGFGTQEDALKQLVRQKGLEEQIVFLGNLDNNDVIRKDFEVKALIMASSREGLPTAIAEALSTGTPVITTNPGDISSVIKNDYNGYIFPLDFNDDDYIESMLLVLANFDRLSAAARESSKVFSSELITRSVIEDINKIIL